MNSFLMQSASVGVIALVAMFPTPDRLRQALTPAVTEIETPAAAPDAVVVDSTSQGDGPVTLEASFPLACAMQDQEDSLLGVCAVQLASFIDKEKQFGEARAVGVPRGPDPVVEQARRALIEICRLRWAMPSPPRDPQMQRICDDIS